MSTTTPRPTPETDAALVDHMPKDATEWSEHYLALCIHSRKLERERDEAREAAARWESSSDAMERAGAEQARRADENREWALGTECERNEVIDQLEAMREAIREVFNSFADEDSAWLLDDQQTAALAKLQPFIQPKP